MQIAVQEGLASRKEHPLQLLHRDLQARIPPKFGRDAVELRRGPAVELSDPIRIGEHQLLSDAAKLGVEAEHRLLIALSSSREREIGGGKQGLRSKRRDVVGESGIADALDQPLAQYDVRLQQFHHDRGTNLVEEI